MIHSTTGLIHTIFAVLAMAFGAVVLLRTKGDLIHKRMGYAYVVCMLGLNGTAFAIYNFGGLLCFSWLCCGESCRPYGRHDTGH